MTQTTTKPSERRIYGCILFIFAYSVGEFLQIVEAVFGWAGLFPQWVLKTGFAVPAFFLGRYLFQFGHRHMQLEAHEAMQEDDRPPILFLRSYQDENRLPVWAPLFDWLVTGPLASLESVLTQVLRDLGPVVAMGLPSDPVPPLGASRFKAPIDTTSWQQQIQEVAERSQLIVVILGTSPSLIWEYDLIAQSEWVYKTIFVAPTRQDRQLDLALASFRRYTSQWDLHVQGTVDRDSVFFFPSGNKSLVSVKCRGRHRSWERWPPHHWDYTKPLKNFLFQAMFPERNRSNLHLARELHVFHQQLPPIGSRLLRPLTATPSIVNLRRVSALAIDLTISIISSVILIFSCIALAALICKAIGIAKTIDTAEAIILVSITGHLDFVVFFPALYFAISEGVFGFSLGRYIFRLKAVDRLGHPISKRQAWKRAFAKALFLSPLFLPVTSIRFMWDGQVLHDLVAGTKVVAKNKGM